MMSSGIKQKIEEKNLDELTESNPRCSAWRNKLKITKSS
jgi:hypothetical protein